MHIFYLIRRKYKNWWDCYGLYDQLDGKNANLVHAYVFERVRCSLKYGLVARRSGPNVLQQEDDWN